MNRTTQLAMGRHKRLHGCRHDVYPEDGDQRAAEPDETIQNLRAFDKLSGVGRYLHPGDAAAVDWEAGTVHGARQVTDSEGRAGLRLTPADLFTPIAPTVHLYETSEHPADLPDGERPPISRSSSPSRDPSH